MKRRVSFASALLVVLGCALCGQVAAPHPSITSIGPTQTTAGAATFTLIVTGSGFLANGVSLVSWGGVEIPAISTFYISANELRVTVDASLITTPGAVQVQVVNNLQIGSNLLQFTVNPPPTITSEAIATAAVGVAYSQKFGVSGGTGPFAWSQLSGLPPGLGFDNAGILSGTPTAAGSYSFTIGVTDSVGVSGRRQYTLTVNPPPLSITTASLPNGTVGVDYSQTLAATGGTPPYTWTSASLPSWLSLSAASGLLKGTPTQTGAFTFTVTVTDSAKLAVTASKQFTVTVNPAPPSIAGLSPAQTTAGVASFALTVTGTGFRGDGVSRVIWNGAQLPLPTSVSATQLTVLVDASLIKTPGTVPVQVVNSGQFSSNTVTFTVNQVPTITPSALPTGFAGINYSQQLGVKDGTGPTYKWAATSLPSWLSLSSGGLLSGTPTATGQYAFTITVTDAAGVSAQARYAITVIVLPAISVTGLTDTVSPAQQPSIDVRLGAIQSLEVRGTIRLTFTPDAVVPPATNPQVQFSTGGTTKDFTIPAGQTSAFPTSPPAIQTGTVAGRINLTLDQLTVGGQPVNPPPTLTPPSVTIARAAPKISSVQVSRTSGGFNVLVTGYSTPRQVTQAVFSFTATSGANLQTTQLTVSSDSAFTTWYSGASSAQFGSSFLYTQPFTVTGDAAAIASVSVTLSNAVGSSSAASANF